MNSPDLSVPIMLVGGPRQATQRLPIGDTAVTFTFLSELVERAANAGGLDRWLVTVWTDHDNTAAVVFPMHGPRFSEPSAPLPAVVLARVASEISLALDMPADASAAVSWLLDEGYAVERRDANAMHGDLCATRQAAETMLAGSGITPAAFCAAASALPLPAARLLPCRMAA